MGASSTTTISSGIHQRGNHDHQLLPPGPASLAATLIGVPLASRRTVTLT